MNENTNELLQTLNSLIQSLINLNTAINNTILEINKLSNSLSDNLKQNNSFENQKPNINESQNLQTNNGLQTETLSLHTKYFGAPSGSGFEESYELDSPTSPKALYVVYQNSGTSATFEPLTNKFVRLKNNSSDLLDPVCIINGNIDTSETFSIEKKGTLTLEKGYWTVVDKCIIKCS